jgi:hypothetical protein
VAGRRSAAAVARKIHGEGSGGLGLLPIRDAIGTGAQSRSVLLRRSRNAAIGDRLAMAGTADQLRWDRKMKVRLGSFRSWRMTVELAAADPRPVVHWLSTTADSGTGADPLRTYLCPSSRALEDNGPCC